MLKKRLVATLTIKNGIVVQSIGFSRYLPVGDPVIAVEFLNRWGIDEIVLLEIDAKKPNLTMVTEVSKKCRVPLTVGGGIRTLQDMKDLIRSGADKVSINTLALENPEIITKAAEIFGNQCIVVSLDIKKVKGSYKIYADGGAFETDIDPIEFAKTVEQLGAGELLVNSIDRDGSKKGYEVEMIKKIANAISIPVIACGGAGKPGHFLDVFSETSAMAAAAGNIFHFSEHSPVTIKSFLLKNGVDVRLDTSADYKNVQIGSDGRIVKQSDDYLDHLRFEYIKPEKI